ncbi:MAG: T9SS type A sorting domain-containing protein [Bacteroidales bacterium]|nr:T9SS type A sorting domain-containing protein [Bacteroidales bacterium]
MKKLFLCLTAITIYAFATAQVVTIPNPLNYPAPTDLSVSDKANLGALIPRTMDLLKIGEKVKIAIYGQSLSSDGNRWWVDLGNALKIAYPTAEIDIRTYGVGGLASNLLWRLTNQELVNFYPDLVVFHVFGNHLFYETIVRQIRGCTAAEMIVQGDHFGINDGTGSAGNWNFDLTNMGNWENYMSFNVVKEYCEKYGLERDNRRQEWYDYLRANSYIPTNLLADYIHFNEQGQWLAADLTARHFVYNPARVVDPNGLLTYYELGKDVFIENGKITLPFEGNKIEIVPSESATAIVSSTIDSKKPSEFPNCYYYTIPSGGFWAGAPFLRPGMGNQQEEDWTITMSGNGDFSVSGSKTGADGNGNKDNLFVSNSKKIVFVNSSDWGNYGVPNTSGSYTFKSKGMFVDKIDFDTVTAGSRNETPIRVIQGISNTQHTLELTSSNGIFPIKFIKVYKPSIKLFVTAPTIVTASNAGGTVSIPVSGNTFWQATHYSNRLGALTNWNNITQQYGSDLSINDNIVNVSCTIPPLTGTSATEYVYIYGQGCDVQVVEIRQGEFSSIDVLGENQISIYPNPVSEKLNVLVNSVHSVSVKVVDVNGRVIIAKDGISTNLSEFQFGAFPAGIYFVIIKWNGRDYCRKIVKF